jgi:PAS domain S-box-containing protein
VDSSAHSDLARSSLDELEAIDEAFLRLDAIRDETGRITDFQYVHCNRAALTVFGRGRDVLGRRLLELFPTHRTNGLFDAYVQVAETAYPTRCEFQFDDNGVVGEFEVSVSRFGDGVILMVHDISDRKRAERQLETLAQQLQGALTSRIVIEQAKGYLAAQSEISLETAFKAIRRYSRDHNVRIGDVARSVVDGGLDLRDAAPGA